MIDDVFRGTAGADEVELGRRLIFGGITGAAVRTVGRPASIAFNRVDATIRHDRRVNVARLQKLRNRHRGERCVIMGNGPSLNETDLGLLHGEAVFGLNRIYLMRDRLGFDPTYHVAVNRLVVEQSAPEIAAQPMPLFTTYRNAQLLTRAEDVFFLPNVVGPFFSRDLRAGIWEGATVTYVAMQIAYYMGFQKVVLVGVDHSFQSKGRAHKEVVAEGPDRDHFDPNYFSNGFRWQLPDLETSELGYLMARDAFEGDGREIVDATVGGRLTVFRKVSLVDALS